MKKIKKLLNYNRFLNKGGVLLLIFLVVGGLFFHYQTADAIAPLLGALVIPLIGKILGAAQSLLANALDALDFVDNTVLKLYLTLIWLTGLASVFLVFSAAFLDWASSRPINLDNNLVTTGWDFTSGLVNMVFILIFIFIALGFIFRQENWGMKKALPRLIIIALLINFSLLFVKIFVDIGWIIQNSLKETFFDQNGSLALTVIDTLKMKLLEVYGKLGATIAGYVLAAMIPVVVVAKLVKLATLVIGETFLGTLSQAILLTIFGFVGGLIFFAYGIFFLLRMIMIWFLAIASPLALVALILPQTQKYFNQWLKALFQWVSLGIVVFFLMGLGLKLYLLVAPPKVINVALRNEGVGFDEGYLQFIFLLIYLWVVYQAAKKFTPAGAEFIWKAVERGGKAAGMMNVAGAWKVAGIAAKTITTATGTYADARKMGMTKKEAFGEFGREIKRGVAPKPPRAIREATWSEIIGAAGRGVLRSVSDAAKTGVIAGLGIQKKKGKKGQPCPNCKKLLPQDADYCSDCGFKL